MSKSRLRFRGNAAKAALFGSALWLIGGVASGFVVAFAYPSHTSVAFVILGALIGAAGAVVNLILCMFQRFRSGGLIMQSMAVGVGVLVLVAALIAQFFGGFGNGIDTFALAIAVVVFVAAFVVAALVRIYVPRVQPDA